MHEKRIGIPSFLYLITKEIVRNILLLIKRRVVKRAIRNMDLTRLEYEEGAWQSVLTKKPWEAYESLEDYVCEKGNNKNITCLINGVVARMKVCEYYTFRRDNLVSLLSCYAGGADEIVEVGCGYGLNLFSLRTVTTPFRCIAGMDISQTALEVAKNITAHFGLNEIKFFPLDLLDDKDANLEQVKGKVVFTYYCLEQLGNYMNKALDNLIRARPKRVIHIEPTREVLNPASLLDLNSIIYSLAMDYPSNLVYCLNSRQQAGMLNICKMEKLIYAPTIRHYPALIVWEPVDDHTTG